MRPRLVIPFMVLLLIGGVLWMKYRRAPGADSSRPNEPPAEATAPPEAKLVVEDLTVGSGAEALAGSRISIHYTGWLNHAKFDSSSTRAPLKFQLGRHEVLAGWDQGIVGMRVGGKRRLTVPPSLGYGKTGSPGGAIPPGSTLVFEIELLEATAPPS